MGEVGVETKRVRLRRILDRVRREMAALSLLLKLHGELEPSAAVEVGLTLEWARFRRWPVAMAMLPPEQRLVLERWTMLGQSRAEVARLLRCSTGTVSHRRERALLQMVVYLEALERIAQVAATAQAVASRRATVLS